MLNAESHSNLHGPRTVALVGTYGSGKTTLFEALLEAAGTPLRHGGEAKPRIPGNETRLAHCSFLGDSWAVLDCPGSIEFSYETACALAVADLALVVAEPDPVRAIALRPVFCMLEAADLPFIVFVNKTDTLAGPPKDLLAALQAETSVPLVLRQVPIREDGAVTGYVDLVSERAYRYRPNMPSELIRIPSVMAETEHAAHEALVDTLADRDDALLEKIIDGAIPTPHRTLRASAEGSGSTEPGGGDVRRGGTWERRATALEGAASRHPRCDHHRRHDAASSRTARHSPRSSRPVMPARPENFPMRGSGAARCVTARPSIICGSAAFFVFPATRHRKWPKR